MTDGKFFVASTKRAKAVADALLLARAVIFIADQWRIFDAVGLVA